MPRKRSLPTTGSVLSSASTESTVSTENSVLDPFAATVEGWMYWKRDAQCWTKVYVVLRKHFLWLLRSSAASSFASPLIHMAVTGVERTTLRSFLVTGPSGETMELHLYDAEDVWTWFDALVEAADWTRLSLSERERLQQEQANGGRESTRESIASSRRGSVVDRAYRGTLVVYNQERQGSRLRQFLRQQSQRLKESVRKRVESVVDHYETVQSRATLC